MCGVTNLSVTTYAVPVPNPGSLSIRCIKLRQTLLVAWLFDRSGPCVTVARAVLLSTINDLNDTRVVSRV